MRSLPRVVAAATITSVALAATVSLSPTAASADASCTAHATLPTRVALGAHPVTIRMTLRGTPGCATGGVDNGATATLVGPGAKDPQRWARFGRTDTQTFQLRVNALGTYTLRDGDVQVYDTSEERVPSQWRSTSVVVKRASRVRDLHRHGSALSGRVQTYRSTGWRGHAGADVVLEKKGATWQPVVQEHAVRDGRFAFTGLHSGERYRVVSAGTRSAWGATSHRV